MDAFYPSCETQNLEITRLRRAMSLAAGRAAVAALTPHRQVRGYLEGQTLQEHRHVR